VIVTDTDNPAERVYRRLGFEPASWGAAVVGQPRRVGP
jgi:hypothetical protein